MNTQRLVGLVGLSGAGKSAIADHLCRWHGFTFLQSYTTRKPRANEPERGGEYIFCTQDEFEKNWLAGRLIERARHGDYDYGLERPASWATRLVAPLNADGVRHVDASYAAKRHPVKPYAVAVIAPSRDILERRNRKTPDWPERKRRDADLARGERDGFREGLPLHDGREYDGAVHNVHVEVAARHVARMVATWERNSR